MRPETLEWVEIAGEDLRSAELLFENGIYRTACFHGQQAVEKTLKSLLVERGVGFARTHNIFDLLALARGVAIEIGLDHGDAGFLNAIYRGRYPSEAGLLPHGEPTREDAQRALLLSRRVVLEVNGLLGIDT